MKQLVEYNVRTIDIEPDKSFPTRNRERAKEQYRRMEGWLNTHAKQGWTVEKCDWSFINGTTLAVDVLLVREVGAR